MSELPRPWAEVEDLLELVTPSRYCTHCRRSQRGSAEVDGHPVCHPHDPLAMDCYHLVTVYGHSVDNCGCSWLPESWVR